MYDIYVAVPSGGVFHQGVNDDIDMDRVNKGWLAKTRRGMETG